MSEPQHRDKETTIAYEEPYDPHDHRNPKRPLSNIEAFIILTKGAIGTGILSASLIYQEGWLTGTIYTCLIGLLVTYCLHILIRSQYRICKRLRIPGLTYSESVKKALEFGPRGLRGFHKYVPFIVDSSILLGQFAICTTYALFILQTFGFFEQYTEGLNIGLKRYVYCIILMVPFIFIIFLGNWKIAAGFSAISNIISLVPFYILFSYLVEDSRPIKELIAVGTIYQFPKFFGPVLLSLEAVAVVSTFENNLKTPKQFVNRWGALNIGMVTVTLLHILVGCLGYFRYGEYAVGSFLNDMPIRDPTAIWCRALYTIVIYLSYGLQGFVLVDVLWKKKSRGHGLKFKHIFRIAFVIGSTLVITLIPFIVRTVILDAMFSIALPLLGIVLPALIEFCVEWPTHHNNRTLTLWKDTALIIFGLVYAFVGLYFCGEQLYYFFSTRRKVIFW